MKKKTCWKLHAACFALLFSLQIGSYGVQIGNVTETAIINHYKTEDVNYTISDTCTLHGMAGNRTYTLYKLQPYGYAILLDETNSLMEACYSEYAQIPVDMDSDELYYYGGPGVYCILKADGYYNVFDEEYLSEMEQEAFVALETSAYAYEAENEYAVASIRSTTSNITTCSAG